MLDHVSLSVKDYAQSKEFYDETLKVLGCERMLTFEIPQGSYAGYGLKSNARPSFWISDDGRPDEEIGRARGLHISFSASTVEAVHAWYDRCLALGATDNGAPGPRPEYHPGYYGAFVIDPNGWRIEACLHHYQG